MYAVSGRSRSRARSRDHALAAFLPTRIPSCVVHLRTDLGITLNGSNTSAWANQGTAGGSVSQGTAANQPTFNASGFGATSKPYLSFDGGDYLVSSTTPVTAGGASTLFIVGLHSAASGGWMYVVRQGVKVLGALEFVSGGVSYISANGVDAGQNVTITSGQLVGITSAHVARWQFGGNGNAPVYARNGAAKTTTGGTQGTENGTAGYTVGGSALGYYLTGSLAEVIHYDRALSAAEISVVERYLGARYGITVS